VFYYLGGTANQWRTTKAGSSGVNFGPSNVVSSAQGFLVRKATGGTTANWVSDAPVPEGLSK
jgi:hypothetical protein